MQSAFFNVCWDINECTRSLRGCIEGGGYIFILVIKITRNSIIAIKIPAALNVGQIEIVHTKCY